MFRACCLVLMTVSPVAAADDSTLEAALKSAAQTVAPMVVKIDTTAGQELLGGADRKGPPTVRKGLGPTTGLVVSADGYIITSRFNFADEPAAVFVTVPGRARQIAKIVASDSTRMLTLLKIDASDLPVPSGVPAEDVQVGRWAIAAGRALNPDVAAPPSLSVGIISAVGRIHGKMIQCDAKVSPVNYGGPLIAIDGRVFGVLVPASPRGETETAGVEWYDSGIGFAVPFDDVLRAVEMLKTGKNLERGLLGITAKVQTELYNLPPEIGAISRESAAEKAGIQTGDVIESIDGRAVRNFSEVQHALGPKYAGDTLTIAVKRAGKRMEFPNITLTAAIASFTPGYLGILPLRDDAKPGVELRTVYESSPAAKAGLKPGDRLLRMRPKAATPAADDDDDDGEPAGQTQFMAIDDRDALIDAMTKLRPGTELEISVRKKGAEKPETIALTLGTPPDEALGATPLPSSARQALARPDEEAADVPAGETAKVETGLLTKTNATLGREMWLYVPENYDKNVAHGVVLWLHRGGNGKRDSADLKRIFKRFCAEHHFILVGPQSKNAAGWGAGETEELLQEVKAALAPYTIDRTRVVAHGMGTGGQMAYYLAFVARDFIRGVATTGAALGTQPREPVPGQPLQFFIVAGEQDSAVQEIAAAAPALRAKRYPVVFRQLKEFGKEYLLETTLAELFVWLDSLDRI